MVHVLFEKIKKRIETKFENKEGLHHAFEVARIAVQLWQKNEKGEAPLALQVAGLYHDIDRLFPKRTVDTKNCSKEEYSVRKAIHSGNSALLFYEENEEMPDELKRDVFFLILRHEFGGDMGKEGIILTQLDEYTKSYNIHLAANYLFYADKLSFFYSNIFAYKKRGKERLIMKIKFSVEGLPSKIKQEIFELRFDDPLIGECMNEVRSLILLRNTH